MIMSQTEATDDIHWEGHELRDRWQIRNTLRLPEESACGQGQAQRAGNSLPRTSPTYYDPLL
jgi:hypothetical protein